MCFIKGLFWDEEDVVIQYHPAKSEYVNRHEKCLHLWRPVGVEMPTPQKELVGQAVARLYRNLQVRSGIFAGKNQVQRVWTLL